MVNGGASVVAHKLLEIVSIMDGIMDRENHGNARKRVANRLPLLVTIIADQAVVEAVDSQPSLTRFSAAMR
jgi:hypothetical protein